MLFQLQLLYIFLIVVCLYYIYFCFKLTLTCGYEEGVCWNVDVNGVWELPQSNIRSCVWCASIRTYIYIYIYIYVECKFPCLVWCSSVIFRHCMDCFSLYCRWCKHVCSPCFVSRLIDGWWDMWYAGILEMCWHTAFWEEKDRLYCVLSCIRLKVMFNLFKNCYCFGNVKWKSFFPLVYWLLSYLSNLGFFLMYSEHWYIYC